MTERLSPARRAIIARIADDYPDSDWATGYRELVAVEKENSELKMQLQFTRDLNDSMLDALKRAEDKWGQFEQENKALREKLEAAEMKCSGCGHASPFHMDGADFMKKPSADLIAAAPRLLRALLDWLDEVERAVTPAAAQPECVCDPKTGIYNHPAADGGRCSGIVRSDVNRIVQNHVEAGLEEWECSGVKK